MVRMARNQGRNVGWKLGTLSWAEEVDITENREMGNSERAE